MDKQLHLRAPEEGRGGREEGEREREREGAIFKAPYETFTYSTRQKTSHNRSFNGHPFHKNGARMVLNGNGRYVEWPVYEKI